MFRSLPKGGGQHSGTMITSIKQARSDAATPAKARSRLKNVSTVTPSAPTSRAWVA